MGQQFQSPIGNFIFELNSIFWKCLCLKKLKRLVIFLPYSIYIHVCVSECCLNMSVHQIFTQECIFKVIIVLSS